MATAKEVRDAITDALLTRVQGGSVLSFSILGKTVTFDSLDAMMRARDKLSNEAMNEEDVGIFLAQFVN